MTGRRGARQRAKNSAQVPLFESSGPAPVASEAPKPRGSSRGAALPPNVARLALPVGPGLKSTAPAGGLRASDIRGPAAELRAARADHAVAIAELLAFDARLIPKLPTPVSLVLARSHGALAVVTTSRSAYTAAQAAGISTYLGGEIEALCLAAEHERASPAEFERWCRLKASDPVFRVTPQLVGGPLGYPIGPRGWPLWRVLHVYEVSLLAVYCDEVPHELQVRTAERPAARGVA